MGGKAMNDFNSRLRFACAVLLCLAVCPQGAQGASKQIEVLAESCSYMLTFDPAKADEARIRDTFELLLLPLWAASFGQAVFSAGEIKTIDLAAIEHRCAASLDRVKSLKLLTLAGVESRRSAVLAELADSCRFDRLNAEGYRNPSVLRQYTPAAACFRYVDAMEGKSDLTTVYDEVSRGCEDNANPKLCFAEVRKRRGNTGEMQVYVHNFGWNNCANAFTLRATADNTEKGLELGQALLKAYKAREVNCDGP